MKNVKKFLFISLIATVAIAAFLVIFIDKPNESNAECKFWGERNEWDDRCWDECWTDWIGDEWELVEVIRCERQCERVARLEYVCTDEEGGEIEGRTNTAGCGDCGSCSDSRYRWCIDDAWGDGHCGDFTCECRPDLCNGGNGNGDGESSPPPPPPPSSPGDFNLSLGGSVACNSVPLSWTVSTNADAYRILRGSPRVDISPYQPYTAQNFTDTSVSQNTSYQYQIEAYNSGGTNRSNEINVTTLYCPPVVNLSANPTSIYQGQSSTLSWSSAYAASCTASGAWSGSKPTSGSEVVIPSPPPSVTYTLTCTGPGGLDSDSVTINITPLFFPNWREIIPR